jgi:hypothetical protein
VRLRAAEHEMAAYVGVGAADIDAVASQIDIADPQLAV